MRETIKQEVNHLYHRTPPLVKMYKILLKRRTTVLRSILKDGEQMWKTFLNERLLHYLQIFDPTSQVKLQCNKSTLVSTVQYTVTEICNKIWFKPVLLVRARRRSREVARSTEKQLCLAPDNHISVIMWNRIAFRIHLLTTWLRTFRKSSENQLRSNHTAPVKSVSKT